MTWGAVAVGAAGVVGAAVSADGAKSAAGAQQAGSDNAIAAQMLASAQMQTALEPWTKAGGQAQTQLNRLLGLGGVGSGGVTSMGLQTGLTPDQVRQQLLSRYTRQASGAGGSGAPAYRTGAEAIAALGEQGAHDYFQQRNTQGSGSDLSRLWTSPNMSNPGMDGYGIYDSNPQQNGPGSTIDEEGLNAEIAKYYAEQKAQEDALRSDPSYGSLMRAYRNGEEFSFTGKDLASDPGYQFGLNQGTQGIQRGQAARGNFLSGAAMKELDRFNQDYAGTKFNEGFGRAQSTWNTNLGAYNQNRNTLYDMLSGVSRTGQNSAAQVGTSNINSAANIGNAMMGAGNAQAASSVVGANSLVSGLNSAVNAFNTNNPNSAAGWNSLISSGATPYGASPTSVAGGGAYVPPTNVFGAANGRVF